MNKKTKYIVIILIIAIICVSVILLNKTNIIDKEVTRLEQKEGITVVPTMRDTLTADSSWCGTFQLVWNDMKNEVVKKDIVFTPQEEIAVNLNKEEFTEDMISEEYYFKAYGLKTLDLKERIEKGIEEKFNQKSDILNDFGWSEDELNNPNDLNINRYFFYVMLYRNFEFLKEFDNLENGRFGTKYNNVEYFGIDEDTKDKVGSQINVLYYNSKKDFAVVINTKTDDEVIFCKGPQGKTFNEIYEYMNKEAQGYIGSRYFEDVDEFKAPKITINEKREYTEIQNKIFETADPVYRTGEISKAIQTIKLSLNEKGGEIKSEAAIDMITSGSLDVAEEPEGRYFYLDDTFAIFLREKGNTAPYFAARIQDITKFQ